MLVAPLHERAEARQRAAQRDRRADRDRVGARAAARPRRCMPPMRRVRPPVPPPVAASAPIPVPTWSHCSSSRVCSPSAGRLLEVARAGARAPGGLVRVQDRKPRPVFIPSSPPLDPLAQVGDGPGFGRGAGSTYSWMASVRSRPTRSAFSIGPSTARRRPKPALTTVSTVSGSQTPLVDERERLPPQRVLEAVADEAGDVAPDVDRLLPDRLEQRDRPPHDPGSRRPPPAITSTSGTR